MIKLTETRKERFKRLNLYISIQRNGNVEVNYIRQNEIDFNYLKPIK